MRGKKDRYHWNRSSSSGSGYTFTLLAQCVYSEIEIDIRRRRISKSSQPNL